MKSIIILLSVILLSGCGTSLKDFQKMSSSERTVKTCSSDYMFKKYKDQQRNHQHEINQLETLLMNGYKTVENCSTVIIDDRHTYLHTGVRNTSDRRQTPEDKKRVIKKCRQQNIPLTSYAVNKYEQRLNELPSLLEEAMFNRQRAYLKCKQRVKDLTPEESYQAYKNQ